MTIKIHRGTHQIGGCITEIRTQKTRILIDMGAELEADGQEDTVSIEGVTTGKKSCDAVFFTHYHGDHLGLFHQLLPEIPVYMGEVAKRIFLILSKRLKSEHISRIEAFQTFHALQKIKVGDIAVTPLLIDHSAYDAYMLLIEAEGKKVLHTGDFRLHGFRGRKTLQLLQKYAGKVDLLITEGTMLSRNDQVLMTEKELEHKAAELMRGYKYVFVLCSSTNVDRIAAFYHANPRGRYFLCDEYQKAILETVSNTGGKRSEFYSIQKVHTYGRNIEDRIQNRGFCMLVRTSAYFKNIMEQYKENSLLIYSMWDGYLSKDSCISEFVEQYNSVRLHTSGHAAAADIREICNAVNPKTGVIPIHSQAPQLLKIPYPLILLEDGEAFQL